MIRETYCPYEVAKLLKEKGFNEKCRGGYHSEFDDNGNPIVMFEEWMAQPHNNDFVDEGFLCSAPTHQMALAWLREVHNVFIYIEPFITTSGLQGYKPYCTKIGGEFMWINPLRKYSNTSSDTYEEAVEAALKYCLENLI